MGATFFILQKKSDRHGQFTNLGYHISHPHLYLARDSRGNETLIMSKISSYAPGQHVVIEGKTLTASSQYFLDATMPSAVPAPAKTAAPPPPGISIAKEIMVVLDDVRLKGNFREAVGTIFYLPPGALDKTVPAPVASCIQEGKPITILTDVAFDELERYRTFLQQAFGFAGLRNVRLPGVLPGSTTLTAEHSGPKPAGYVSIHALDDALRP